MICGRKKRGGANIEAHEAQASPTLFKLRGWEAKGIWRLRGWEAEGLGGWEAGRLRDWEAEGLRGWEAWRLGG